MRYKNLFGLIVIASLLASCEINIDWGSSSSTPSSSSEEVSSSSSSFSSSSSSSSSESTPYVPSPEFTKTEIKQTYNDYAEGSAYTIDAAPSSAQACLLVVPIWFTDSSNFIDEDKKDNVRSDIEMAYFGTEEETGWHSVRSFYEAQSLGELFVDGLVTDWYEVDKPSSSFSQDDTVQLVNKVRTWYFDNNPSDSPRNYDGDFDGYMDSIMLIYAAPDSQSLNQGNDNLWAYAYWVQNPKAKNPSNPGANSFFWASYDFMYNKDKATQRAGHFYGNGYTTYTNIDSHTFIHEMGHLFGLDDYYDYSYKYSPAGGFSMQDYNIGGHDPFSNLALGWADPYIPTESCTIDLKPFQNEHELILLTPEWNEYDSPFDEYLLLELYTPTGLNEMDVTHPYKGSKAMAGPSDVGIRLWHVDARLAYYYIDEINGNPSLVTSLSTLGNNVFNDKYYGCFTAFSNTYENNEGRGTVFEDCFDYNLLQLIRNDKSETYRPKSFLKSSYLFKDGDSFSMDKYASQFVNGDKLNSTKSLGWSFSVEIWNEGENAIASVHLIKE